MDIVKKIKQLSETVTDPAGRDISVLKEKKAIALSQEANCHLRDIYIQALGEDIWPYRYIRNHASVSSEEQLTLSRAVVIIAGAGGLGGHVITLLARMGIGYIHIFDNDRFDETNLNRQVLSTTKTLGDSKTDTAKAVVAAVNPAVMVSAYNEPITKKRLTDVLEKSHAVVDALDNINDRFMLEEVSKEMNTPLVHGAIAGFDGQVMTIFPEDKGLRQIYGAPPHRSLSQESPEAVLGNPPITPSAVASFQCAEVIKIILGKEDILRNTLLHMNLITGHFHKYVFKK